MLNQDRFYGKVNLNKQIAVNLAVLEELDLNLELCITDSSFLFGEFDVYYPLLQQYLSKKGSKVNMHLPFYGLQLGCKDPYIRKLSHRLIMQGLRRAADLGIRKAVMHVSFPPQIPIKGREHWLDQFCFNLEKILSYCRLQGITLLIENTYESSTTIFSDIFSRFPEEELAMCLDVGHVYCFSKSSIEEWWNSFREKIKIIHLSDNSADDDSHLALGDGSIDFPELFRLTAPGFFSFNGQNKNETNLTENEITYTLETEVSCFKRSLLYLERIFTAQ